MNINFPPIDEHFIRSTVETGYYSNANELVRDAVRRLRENFNNKRTPLQIALDAGEADIRAGRTVPYTPELLDQIMQDAIKHAAEGRKPNPDVCP